MISTVDCERRRRGRRKNTFRLCSLKVFVENSRKIEKLPAAQIGSAEITLRDQMDCLTSSPTLNIVRGA